jgi:hypothetical protein
MIPEFTQAIFLRSLDEWGAYPDNFKALTPDEQAEFSRKQGFTLPQMLAHVGVWWEEARGIVQDAIEKRERPRRKYDFDEFNAASLARFQDASEAELLKWYESERQKILALVSSLDSDEIKMRRVYGWLDAVTLFHLKEHGIGAPRFLILDTLQREWAAYADRFHALTEEEQKAFLEKQGFPRFRDLAAHIVAWWEEGIRLIEGVAKDPAHRMPDMDTDAFNALVMQMFGLLAEVDVWKRYETTRAALIELAINLPDDTYEHEEVQAWLRSDVIEHYFDHSI